MELLGIRFVLDPLFHLFYIQQLAGCRGQGKELSVSIKRVELLE
jgi:hypothetical protein